MDILTRISRFSAYRNLQRENAQPGKTLSSKILYKMAWDRNPLLSVFADKLSVRNYIENLIGTEALVPILGIFDRSQKIDFTSLPRQFVLKVNHGSGGVIVVSEKANKENILPAESETGWVRFEIHPDSFNAEDASRILDHWLTLNYEWWTGRKPEWCYRNVVPKIFIEEFLNSQSDGALSEYKAFVINGHVQVIRVDRGNVSLGKSFAHYGREWNYHPVTFIEAGHPHNILPEEPPPPFLDQIIRISEKLMEGVDFARVDFLDDGGELKIGEITNYPTAGNFDFDPPSFSEWFGISWRPEYSHSAKWWKFWLR